jgi:DNA-binding SARP family transcriptional activator
MNRGKAAEHAKRLRADIRTQRIVLVRDMPETRDLAALRELTKLDTNCRTLCLLVDDLAEHDASGRNRSLFSKVAKRALALAHLYAQLGRTLEELSGVQPSPRERRLYDEFERRRGQVLDRSREFEIVLDEFIRWAASNMLLCSRPARRQSE